MNRQDALAILRHHCLVYGPDDTPEPLLLQVAPLADADIENLKAVCYSETSNRLIDQQRRKVYTIEGLPDGEYCALLPVDGGSMILWSETYSRDAARPVLYHFVLEHHTFETVDTALSAFRLIRKAWSVISSGIPDVSPSPDRDAMSQLAEKSGKA